jgi:hypothetical protein
MPSTQLGQKIFRPYNAGLHRSAAMIKARMSKNFLFFRQEFTFKAIIACPLNFVSRKFAVCVT